VKEFAIKENHLFAKAYKNGRYKSYHAYYNKGSFGADSSQYKNEEIDLNTMIF